VTTFLCPHCERLCDISTRTNGDRVWCLCGKWYQVVMRPDGYTYLAKCDPPAGILDGWKDDSR
jgi:hypothetical protein